MKFFIYTIIFYKYYFFNDFLNNKICRFLYFLNILLVIIFIIIFSGMYIQFFDINKYIEIFDFYRFFL